MLNSKRWATSAVRILALVVATALARPGLTAPEEEKKDGGVLGALEERAEAAKKAADEAQRAAEAAREAEAKKAAEEKPGEPGTPAGSEKKAAPAAEAPAAEPKEKPAAAAAPEVAPAPVTAEDAIRLNRAVKLKAARIAPGVKLQVRAVEAKLLEDVKAAVAEAAPAEPATAPAEPAAVVEGQAAPAAPAAPAEPQIPMFRLRDGTRLAGKPELVELQVTTAYGKLLVPIPEVLRVRFAAGKDTTAEGIAEQYVKALGSEEFDAREEAVEKLREIGVPALGALKKALESEDAEVKTRAEKLIGEIEETIEEEDPEVAHLSPISGEDDEVVTVKFTVMGRIEIQVVPVDTRYGGLKLDRKDIVSIVFKEAAVNRKTFQVPGGTFAAANKWVVTDQELTEGQKVRIKASGTLNLENFGQTCGPEGTTNIGGNQFQSFPAGSLVARIGDKGKAFQVGAEYDGAANATGKLQLSVSLQNGQVSGQFDVTVETEAEQ